MAPVNHNKLDQSKTTEILHTILGNAYQDENDPNLANQDFGNDACVLVGCNETVERATTNKVKMVHLHPNTDITSDKVTVSRTLFPSDMQAFNLHISSSEFVDFLGTDATTADGQKQVAEYYGIQHLWTDTVDESCSAMTTYVNLLKLVKSKSTKDKIWISFWEGMHRHAAIMMSMLGANITHNTNSWYEPNTLDTTAFSTYITGFTNPGQQPLDIIEDIFTGKNVQAIMLKTKMMVTAYVPNSSQKEIPRLFVSMIAQSKHVSENKLTSASRTLPILLSDWLKLCAPQTMNKVTEILAPCIKERFTVQKAMDFDRFKIYKNAKSTEMDINNRTDITIPGWLPKCITKNDWVSFIKNPFDQDCLSEFTQKCLSWKDIQDKTKNCSPPYRITFQRITFDVLPIKNGMQNADVRLMNAYQIIPGLVYTLYSKLVGRVLKIIMNEDEVVNIINFIARYCYAVRSSPIITMHGACEDYKIPPKQLLSSCEGVYEIIPVTVLLVSMYNACYTYQRTKDNRMNLLALALETLDLGSRGSIGDKGFVRTLSKSVLLIEQTKFIRYNAHWIFSYPVKIQIAFLGILQMPPT